MKNMDEPLGINMVEISLDKSSFYSRLITAQERVL